MKSILVLIPILLLTLAFTSSCAEPEQLYYEPTDTEPPKPVELLALGDSYTIGQSVAEADRWPNLLAAGLQTHGLAVKRTEIIARTGWRTDNLMAAIDAERPDSNFNLVGLLIGVNNQYQGRSVEEYEPQFTALLDRAVALAQGNKSRVFVVSIPDYGYTPYGQSSQAGISEEIDAFNAANLRITQAAGIQYFDITPISRQGLADPDLVADDGLHPSGKQYAAWVESMLPTVLEMVK